MSIDNKLIATRMIWFIISAILVDLCGLLTCILFRIDEQSVYIATFFLLMLLVFRLLTLRYFKLEISEELISIKYHHPLMKNYRSANLELPWYKITACQLEKGLFSYYISIGVSGKRRSKMFHYNLGVLSKRNIYNINESVNIALKKYS